MINMVQKKQKKTSVINGKRLTIEQHNNLLNGKTIFVEGMQRKDGSLFNSHIKLSDDSKRIEYLRGNKADRTQQNIQQLPKQQQEQQHSDSSIISDSIGLFDLPADGGDDSEESLFRNRMQRQQKKKKRGFKM